MIITNLSERLSKSFEHASEIWIAVALMSDNGFDLLASSVRHGTKVRLLVGVDLPTSIHALKRAYVLNKTFGIETRIYLQDNGIFHPKCYIVKEKQRLVAFVGSANLTNGGLNNNVELTVQIDDQSGCQDLKDWFDNLYSKAYPLTKENINSYNDWLEETLAAERIKPIVKPLRLTGASSVKKSFDDLDFSDRFFKKRHHLAFKKENWRDSSSTANIERRVAHDRFMELHNIIFPRFKDYGLEALATNVENHIVSMDHHFPDRPLQELNAMWLSYGKTREEIKDYKRLFPSVTKNKKDEESDLQSFINHARIQIRIELQKIGIWILFGKNNGGSQFDRHFFQQQMQNKIYRDGFYLALRKLPAEYWILVNQDKINISDFPDADSLHDFCKKDNPLRYFIIGRDYNITDIEMSEEKLPETTLVEFRRLYPIYKMMRHYL